MPQAYRILIIDDSREIVTALKAFFERKYDVITANDGIEGLLALEQNENSIDLVISDLLMPDHRRGQPVLFVGIAMKLFGSRRHAPRAVFSLVLSVLACVAAGCAACPSPYDYDYNAFGGTHDRVDRCRGRAGSAFEPADPFVTPPGIKPEWYFLWAYQTLKIFPSELIGLGVQGAFMSLLALLPFLDRGPERRPAKRPIFVTVFCLALLIFLAISIWGHYS